MNETNHPARRLRHGERPTEPLVFDDAAANKAAEEGGRGLPALPRMNLIVTEKPGLRFESRGYTNKQMHDYARQAIASDRASRQVANKAEVEKAAAWIDQFGNVWPLGAYSPTGKPNYIDADKRGWKPLFRSICAENTGLIDNFEQAFFVVQDSEGNPDFVTRTNAEAQEHINDACEMGVEGAGKWKSIPVFKMVELEPIQTMASDNAATPPDNKAEVEPEPFSYVKFRAAQNISSEGDVDANEWYEFCEQEAVGDDKLPAFPVYVTPPATTGASTVDLRNDEVFDELLGDYGDSFGKLTGDIDPEPIYQYIEQAYAKVDVSTVQAEVQVFFNGAWKPATAEAFYSMAEDKRRVFDITREVAAQAGQVAVPEGWKLMPRKPSQEHVAEAAYEISRKNASDIVTPNLVRMVYETMIYALPPSPAKESK